MVADSPTPEVYPLYPGTWQEFCSWFAEEQACAVYLERLRWPAGVRCPKCESEKGWRTADGRWVCADCGRKVSVTAGTIFDRSRISLQEWFAAAWYMTNQKHGVSALGRVRMQRVDDVSGASLIPFVSAAIESGSEVHTDGWKGYNGLSKQGYSHRVTNISSSGDPAHVSMPGVHRIASLLKRWLLGTHQGSVTAAHLGAYINEFAFRFNRRHSRCRGLLFLRLLQHAVVTLPTRYRPSRSRNLIEKHNL